MQVIPTFTENWENDTMENAEYEDFVSKDELGFYNISVEGAKKMMDKKDAFVLDVRDEYSFAAEHLENALRMDIFDIESRINEFPNDQKILTFCEIGLMSQAASKKLLDLGFNDVYNVTGGFNEWKKAGYPIEK
jgi:rhodanese-related sulfurtransferase